MLAWVKPPGYWNDLQRETTTEDLLSCAVICALSAVALAVP